MWMIEVEMGDKEAWRTNYPDLKSCIEELEAIIRDRKKKNVKKIYLYEVVECFEFDLEEAEKDG